MGLRGFVDAWGVPVIREGFTRPALTEPVKATANKPANKSANTSAVSTPPANKPEPVAAPAPDLAKLAPDRAAYMRELMRAKRARAKQTKI